MERTVWMGPDGELYSDADKYAKEIINNLSEKNLTYEEANFILKRARSILKQNCRAQKM